MLKVTNLYGRPSVGAPHCRHFSLPERGAHGGTPIQVFIKISVTNY